MGAVRGAGRLGGALRRRAEALPGRGRGQLNDLTAALLAELYLPPPYLLVGHSVGGLPARAFAARYPERSCGLVLAESSHPEQLRRSSAQRDMAPWVANRLSTLYWRTLCGRRLPDPDTVAVMSSPGPWRAALREFQAFRTGRWGAAEPLPGRLPVCVITAGRTGAGDPAHAGLQAELAGLTQVGRHVVAEDVDHIGLVMHEEHAHHVVSAINWAASSQPSRS